MERTTNSADARRAADYLSRYCNENGTDVCKGCFARIEAKPNPNHRYFKGEGQRTIPLPTGAFNNLRPGEIINLADIVGGTDDAR